MDADPIMPKPQTERTPAPAMERCPSCNGVINPQTGECRCSD